MKKSKIQKIIALGLFLFYIFATIISFSYEPPKHNYTKADIEKIKSKQRIELDKKLEQQQKSKTKGKVGEKSKQVVDSEQKQWMEYFDVENNDDQQTILQPIIEIQSINNSWKYYLYQTHHIEDDFNIVQHNQVEAQVNTLLNSNKIWKEYFIINHHPDDTYMGDLNQQQQQIVENTLWQMYFIDICHIYDDNANSLIDNDIIISQTTLWRQYFQFSYHPNVEQIYIQQQEGVKQNITQCQQWKQYFLYYPEIMMQIKQQEITLQESWKNYFNYNYHEFDNSVGDDYQSALNQNDTTKIVMNDDILHNLVTHNDNPNSDVEITLIHNNNTITTTNTQINNQIWMRYFYYLESHSLVEQPDDTDIFQNIQNINSFNILWYQYFYYCYDINDTQLIIDNEQDYYYDIITQCYDNIVEICLFIVFHLGILWWINKRNNTPDQIRIEPYSIASQLFELQEYFQQFITQQQQYNQRIVTSQNQLAQQVIKFHMLINS